MRSVSELAKMKGRIYVYLCNDAICRKFLMDAEAEGFRFGDGVKPTERSLDDIYAVNRNRTIHFVGFAGHMAFHHPRNADRSLIRVDYDKYSSGLMDYII